MSRGGAGREGSSPPWGLGVAGGEVFQSRTSRAAATSRGRAGDELGGAGPAGGGAGPAGGASGMSRGRDWRSRGREDEQRRSRTCREVARRRGPAARTTKSDLGTSEWRHAPFYSSRASVLWSRAPGRAGNPPALRFGALNWPRSRSRPPPRCLRASKRDYGHSQGDGLRLAPNRRLVDA